MIIVLPFNNDIVNLINMENIEWASKPTWDNGKFKGTKEAICTKYPLSHVHDAILCAAIMAIPAEADEARDLSRATAPTKWC